MAKRSKPEAIATTHEERTEALATTINTRVELARHKAAMDAAMAMGAVGVISRLAKKLNAETIKALAEIRETKSYQNFTDQNGKAFERFDDFCDFSEYSPMPYKKFWEQERLLADEGEETFNLLSAGRVPVTTRKALPSGTITIDGDEVVIAGDDGEQRIRKDDLEAITQTIKELARANAEKEKKISEGYKQLEAIKRRVDDAEDVESHLRGEIEKLEDKIESMEEGYALPKHLPPVEAALGQLLAASAGLRREILKLGEEARAEFAATYARENDLANNRILHALGMISDADLTQFEILANQAADEFFANPDSPE